MSLVLIELCEPLFQYVCRLNRSARSAATIGPAAVRADLDQVFSEIDETASARPELKAQFKKIQMPLIFFADYMIKSSELKMARDWEEMQRDFGEHAGDEKFFDLLEDDLAAAERGDADAQDRLVVYYQCIGLGFQGFHEGQTEKLRSLMEQMGAILRKQDLVDLSDKSLVCSEAYENIDTSDLIEPPAKKMVGVTLAVVGLVLALFVTNIALFLTGRGQLDDALERIVQNDPVGDDAPARAEDADDADADGGSSGETSGEDA
ncbi:MAG: DotU family type IV/VI secretion system protein [Planctomycetota bacterium]